MKFAKIHDRRNRRSLGLFESQAFSLMNKLYAIAMRLTRDRFDAEDLVQETYLKAWKSFHRFERGTNLQAWMLTILYNSYFNEYRRKQRSPVERNLEKVAGFIPIENNQNENPQVNNYREIFDDFITSAMDRLPERYRVAVLLVDVQEMKYKEVAKILDCPIGTVMSRLSRGRQMLAGSLRAYGETNGYLIN